MAIQELITYQDLLDHLIDFQRANPSAFTQRAARSAIENALRILPTEHSWSYYYGHSRITTVAAYTTGTVAYDHTGGDYERVVTLTDGTWPDWTNNGNITINSIVYPVAERRSDTQLQLPIATNPGTDVASGTSFTLYRDAYLLPQDLVFLDTVYTPNSWRTLKYVHPRDWLVAQRYNPTGASPPYMYTIQGSTDYQSLMEIVFYPYPDTAQEIDFVYSRGPRPLVTEYETTGTVTASGGSYAINGQGTEFTDEMVGSIIRFTSNSAKATIPTGKSGANPYHTQRMIMNRNSDTQIEVDQPMVSTLNGVKYSISDPIDVELKVMGPVLYRLCEAQLGKVARFADRRALEEEYQFQLERAKGADSRSKSPRVVGEGVSFSRRMANMPAGADVD